VYDVPEVDLLSAARSITGWKLVSYSSYMDTENCVVTELMFNHTGGILFPTKALMVDGVKRIHHYVQNGKARVWVTWKPELALAGNAR
jgi:hypothetical protein